MFHATLDSSKTWKQIVDALATLLTEVHFVISKKGISLRQLDSSKAAMVELDLPAGVFLEYNCDDDHEVWLGMDELTKVSKRTAADDKLEFDIEDERFHIKMVGQAERLFKLQMLKPIEEQTKRPNLEFDVKAEMFADAFKQAVKDIGVISNYVKITAEKDSITFTGEGDTGEAEVTLTSGEEAMIYNLEVNKKASAMYALVYLSEIVKAMSGDSLMLQFSGNKPMMMEFGIAEGGRINFVLAPRVERK